MIVPVPIIVFPLALLGVLVLSGGTTVWGYYHGKAAEKAEIMEAQNVRLQQDLKDHQKNDEIADAAGKQFEIVKPVIVRDVQFRDREVLAPPDADPFVPVWYVRMWHRLVRPDVSEDPYPGQSPESLSTTRLSGTREVLKAYITEYETCDAKLKAIDELKPILPPPPEEEKSLVERLF